MAHTTDDNGRQEYIPEDLVTGTPDKEFPTEKYICMACGKIEDLLPNTPEPVCTCGGRMSKAITELKRRVPKVALALKVMLAIPEYWKAILIGIQRLLMVILTIAVLFCMIHVGDEIVTMRNELEKARTTIEQMKTEITNLTTEIHKGIKIRFW